MQLPDEAKKFDIINKAFKTIMQQTNQQPNVVKACTSNNCLNTLKELGDRLDRCQKSLSDYLEGKRSLFARFFFISDDELLSVLGSSDATSIQVHMLKLFDNVKHLKFNEDLSSVTGMISSEQESFDFVQPSTVNGEPLIQLSLLASSVYSHPRSCRDLDDVR